MANSSHPPPATVHCPMKSFSRPHERFSWALWLHLGTEIRILLSRKRCKHVFASSRVKHNSGPTRSWSEIKYSPPPRHRPLRRRSTRFYRKPCVICMQDNGKYGGTVPSPSASISQAHEVVWRLLRSHQYWSDINRRALQFTLLVCGGIPRLQFRWPFRSSISQICTLPNPTENNRPSGWGDEVASPAGTFWSLEQVVQH